MYVWVTENLAIEQQLKVETEKCQLELKQAGGFQLNTLTARVHLFCQTGVRISTFSTQLRMHSVVFQQLYIFGQFSAGLYDKLSDQ